MIHCNHLFRCHVGHMFDIVTCLIQGASVLHRMKFLHQGICFVNCIMLIKCFQHGRQSLSYFGVEKIRDIRLVKGQPGALKLPRTQGPGRPPSFGVLYATLPCFFTQVA